MRGSLFWMAILACSHDPSGSGSDDSGDGSTKETPGYATEPGSTTPVSTGTTASTGETGAAPTGCAAHGYAFCEDFEAGRPGETPPGWTEYWGWDSSGSRAVLTTDEQHGGSQSLAGAIGVNGQFRVAHALDGELAGHHWGRVFYQVQTPVALDGQYVHNTFVAFGHPDAGNGTESRVVDTVVDPTGAHQFLFNVPDDSCCAGSSYDYRYEGGWHCAEWYVEAATESFRYDGAEVTDLAFAGVEGAHIADFDSVIVGWIDYQSPSTPNVGWFDDLALDDERIGCD